MECAICYSQLKSSAKRFTCRKCRIVVCMSCFKDLLDRSLYVPTCCQCRTVLNYDDIVAATSKTYFKTKYIDHLADVQFKMLTEQTIQVLYPLIYKINNLRDQHLTKIDGVAAKLYREEIPSRSLKYRQNHYIYPSLLQDFLNFVHSSNVVSWSHIKSEDDVPIDVVCEELNNLKNFVPPSIFKEFLKQNWNIDDNSIHVTDEIEKLVEKKTDNKVVAKCEKCRLGIIQEVKEVSKIIYECNSCKQRYCPKCLVALCGDAENHSNHQCKEADIASWEEIKKSTKLCPKCSSRIFKTMGCSQMFCTNCHTGFDWNTGRIINGNFHNPHRMEWLRHGGGNGGNECGNIDSVIDVGKVRWNGKSMNIPYYDELLRLVNYHNELGDAIAKYTRDYELHNRINYYDLLRWYYRDADDDFTLFGKIDETKYKADIKTKERHKFRDSTILSIITPISDIIHDGVMAIIDTCNEHKDDKDVAGIPEVLELNQNTEFDDTNIKIEHYENGQPKYFKGVIEIFGNMIRELVSFDINLYSVEKIVEDYVPHFMFYTIPDILTGYSIDLSGTGCETNYQLYFILNELCVRKDQWEEAMRNEEYRKGAENYVSELIKKHPVGQVNVNSMAAEILLCRELEHHYKADLRRTNIIHTGYLTEQQKVILFEIIDDNFSLVHPTSAGSRTVRRRRTTRRVGNGGENRLVVAGREVPDNLADLPIDVLEVVME